jgi:hypothetical protein
MLSTKTPLVKKSRRGSGIMTMFEEISETGNPISANSMAGAKICSIVNFPLPNLSMVSTQPAAAPGTVTA